ncbi:MAG: endonuclease [Crenarchaeota archaeon]|nr:endonuclease [Thermoproteota archaeon]
MSSRPKKELRIVKKEDNYYIIEGEKDSVVALYEQGIGEKVSDARLKVSPIELAYLTTRFRVIDRGSELSIGDVLKDVNDILKLIVYVDLRKRGYNVKITPDRSPIDLLVWEKGKKPGKTQPRYAIKIVTEGLGIRALDLSSILKYCESMGLQLVLALLSNDGVVTYYKAFSLKDLRAL